MRHIGCIWYIFPGLLLSHELYGMIYADLTPGQSVDESFFRYGWLSPVAEPPDGMPTPEEMAARAALAITQDQVVWEGCGRRSGTRWPRLRADRAQREGRPALSRAPGAERTGYAGLRYV